MASKIIEPEVQQAIECIEHGKNFILTGGAGSGKTYSLISLIEEVGEKYPLKSIVCITYTNNAVAEIRNRITNDKLYVSTIHEFIWSIIVKYQKEINKICDYLFKVEVWQHFEMTTFMNLMFAFSDDMILALFESSKETMAENATNPYYTSLTTSFFINGIILGFQRKNDQILTQFLTGLTTVAKKPKYMYAKMIALYFEKLLQARDASDPASVDFTDFYHALALFGMIEKAQELQEFYTEIVENN